jgi:pimeloyl-ACP methyl ester carboxylesterase
MRRLLPARPSGLEVFDRGMRRLARARGIASRQVEGPADGHDTVHFYDGAGRGPLPTVVFQHGLGAANASQFVPMLVAARAEFRRVVAIDLPGHGWSSPVPSMTTERLFDAYAHVLDHHVDGPLVLVGNSLGGALSLEYALRRPERVTRLVLTSPAGAPYDDAEHAELQTIFAMPDRAAVADFFQRMHARPPAWTPLVADDIRARFAQPHIRELVASFAPGEQFEAARLHDHRVPTLLVWGEADRLLPRSMLAWWRRHLPARIEAPAGVGHAPHLDQPVWHHRLVRDFAASP